MKHCVQKFILFAIILISSFLPAHSLDAIKINNLVFDNSDGIIFVSSTGAVDNNVTFSKGYLKDPNRVYIDINNAILTTPKKSYTAKYSAFNNVKISQFSLEPKVVRIVFEYNKKLDLASFKTYKTSDSIFIKTNKKLVKSPRFKTVYSNTGAQDRISFFEGTKFEEDVIMQASDLIQSESAPQNEITKDFVQKAPVLKTNSKFYIDSITKTKNGILINGLGKLSLFPSFTLKEPDRLIIDLDDTVCSQELRNKTYPIGELQAGDGNLGTSIDKRETIRLGQNTQSTARLVIQGENAGDYRGIISPDSKSLYITNKANIITTKMSDTNSNLIKTAYSNLKGLEVISFVFDDSVSFNTFEEGEKLYIDINNLNMYQDAVMEPILKAIPNTETIRLALDKLRIVLPQNQNLASGVKKYISIKTNPDNSELRIYSKTITSQTVKKPSISIAPVITAKKRTSEISNLFTVVIDAGHGGSDVGATRENIYEKDITLKIAKMVEEKLKKKNVKTYMVRDKDKTVSLSDRCDFSNDKKPDVFVSVHVNSSLNENIYGVETHWWKEDSHNYAKTVHKEMQKKIKSWKTTDRGLFKSQFYVINHTEAPAILCEIGFISNRDEREEIVKTKRQEEIAEAIADGIYNYLKAKK